MIPSSIIEEVRSKADIIKIISEYVQLKKRGKNYLGLCPFHAEKTPSFTVSPEKQLFHCFGCNEGGNIFAFVMKLENLGFAQAVEEIGAKTGVAVPKFSGPASLKSDKDKLYQVMLLASQFYQQELENESGEAARSYLQRRGISLETAKRFHLGFAPAGWDNLFKFLVGRGSAPKLIEQSGLILSRENQSGYYDRFRNRLLFSVSDHRDRVVAFSGRTMGEEEPKYLNSPDTPLYHKGELLYGLNLAKESIRKNKTAILVEGNFDLITSFQAGITNIVATLGTALTVSQCKLLARYCDTVIMAYDADLAGGAAAERSAELLRQAGIKVKVAQLSGGKDPDEVIGKQGVSAFSCCLDAALPYTEFLVRRTLGRYNLNEIESRAKALKAVAAVIGQAEDDFVQKEYAKLAAAWLKVEAETVLAESKRLSYYRHNSGSSLRQATQKPNSKIAEAEKNLIILAARDQSVLAALKEQLTIEDFASPETRAIAELLLTADFAGGSDPTHFLLDNLPTEEAKKFLARLLVSEHLSQGEQQNEILNDCIRVIKQDHLKNKIETLKLEIQTAEKAGATEKVTELLAALNSEII